MTFTESARTKTITLAASEVAEVTAALAAYEAARAELETAAHAGLVKLRSRHQGVSGIEGGRR